jgi:hypothetical protein
VYTGSPDPLHEIKSSIKGSRTKKFFFMKNILAVIIFMHR